MNRVKVVRIISIGFLSVLIASCASSSGEIATAYVSPTQYAAFNCDQLALELARLNRRKSELAANIDKKASSDEGMTAISAIFFWPAAFAIGGNEAQEAEYARLKGEYDAVQQAGIEKSCRLNPQNNYTSPLVSNYGSDSPASAFEYYGEAEDEIRTGDVDKNLWARALVEVEGDETKRKAKYIELRASQIFAEKGGGAANVIKGTPVSVKSEIGTLSGRYRLQVSGLRKISTVIDLEQDKDKISGISIDRRVEMKGVVDGDKVTFTYDMIGATGKGKLKVKENGVLTGEWQGISWGEGKWHMVRIE